MTHDGNRTLCEVVKAATDLLDRLPRDAQGRIFYGFDLRKNHESEWGGPKAFERLAEAVAALEVDA